ncbi:hypothetical protein [Streptomyces sp. WAC06614]|uniref:hypothetical protein n=1 Tax=Streptomyces sp. WAC06614 TaxID=2487416 RepID=UPI000F7A30EB|nr:hypothetical protein [Streptomyces sp. WAC06614]RSS57884.1 hypothetical protein EF918_33825 [Streptomyces sp. WAC06614]
MAHAAPAARGRHLDRAALTVPLVLGLLYGVYAAFMKRQTGPVDAGNVFYGILCGVVFAACLVAMARVGPRMMRELRAAMYGAFAAIAMGYLYSLTGDSVLRSVWIGLLTGAGVGIVAFYRYYTHEP